MRATVTRVVFICSAEVLCVFHLRYPDAGIIQEWEILRDRPTFPTQGLRLRYAFLTERNEWFETECAPGTPPEVFSEDCKAIRQAAWEFIVRQVELWRY